MLDLLQLGLGGLCECGLVGDDVLQGVDELTDLTGSDPAHVLFRRIILAMSCPFPCGTSWGNRHPGLEILNRNAGGGFLGVVRGAREPPRVDPPSVRG